MYPQPTKTQKRFRLFALLFSGLLLGMSTALVIYVNSSFLEVIAGGRYVGVLFSAAYLVSLYVVQQYGNLIRRFTNAKVLFFNMWLQVASLLTLGFGQVKWLLVLAFITFIVASTTTIINYDLYLKGLATRSKTGRLRGLFWTMVNLGFVISPFVTGRILDRFGYAPVYATAALLIIPAFLLMMSAFRRDHAHAPLYKHEPIMETLRRMWSNWNFRGIFIIAFTLYFFYSWMIIYTPLYLLQGGFDWKELGLIFSIMLIPFVIIEYPAGYIADKYLGETEMLAIGLIIMALAIFLFMGVSSFGGVLAALFLSRVGASLVEIMRESYFYKIVKGGDIDMIDAFRNINSVAHIVGPAVASSVLAFGFGLHVLFVILALILVFAAAMPSTMTDTR